MKRIAWKLASSEVSISEEKEKNPTQNFKKLQRNTSK